MIRFEWNPRKARENLLKHGVDFADAALALEDVDQNERRFKTLGMGPAIGVLLVIHCERSANKIRIISARSADKREAKAYFQGLNHE